MHPQHTRLSGRGAGVVFHEVLEVVEGAWLVVLCEGVKERDRSSRYLSECTVSHHSSKS